MSEIMDVPLPRADSSALMSFLIFHISMFLSVSPPPSDIVTGRRHQRKESALQTPQQAVEAHGDRQRPRHEESLQQSGATQHQKKQPQQN